MLLREISPQFKRRVRQTVTPSEILFSALSATLADAGIVNPLAAFRHVVRSPRLLAAKGNADHAAR